MSSRFRADDSSGAKIVISIMSLPLDKSELHTTHSRDRWLPPNILLEGTEFIGTFGMVRLLLNAFDSSPSFFPL
jgi:hypothetical protein